MLYVYSLVHYHNVLLKAPSMTVTTTPNINTVFTQEQEELLDYIAEYHEKEFAQWFDDLEPELEQKLIDELSDIGIETRDQFEDRYCGHFDSWHSTRDFAEQWVLDYDLIDTDNPLWSFVDFDEVWNRMLTYDYDTINDEYFFRNH